MYKVSEIQFTIYENCIFVIFYFRAPYGLQCLAPYGGPIEPGLALGGSTKSDFTDSNAVSLTFLVTNTIDKEELQPALLWEQK